MFERELRTVSEGRRANDEAMWPDFKLMYGKYHDIKRYTKHDTSPS